jgi:hypothetical protein
VPPHNKSDEANSHLTPYGDSLLDRLRRPRLRANVHKRFFARKEHEHLGYGLTRQGIQPQPKKVEAPLRLESAQLRRFLGMVNYYRDMW